MDGFSANDSYVLHEFERHGAQGPMLDYGCGDGHLVAEAVRRGHDAWGVEKYYADRHDFQTKSEARTPVEARGRIKVLDDNDRIPWPDNTFGFVSSNQVLEHVEDLELTVSEIARVTRPGGWGLQIFPTRERIIEPHVGVPFYHRVPRRLRPAWARPWYEAKVAYRIHPDHESWAGWRSSLEVFFHESVHLRPARHIEAVLGRYFELCPVEVAKVSYHAGRTVPRLPGLRRLEHRRVGVALLTHRLG